jgi:hypothetical protein
MQEPKQVAREPGKLRSFAEVRCLSVIGRF